MTLETHNTNPIKATKPRRWFRFRLRTLLVMVTLLSVPLGWVGWELDQRRRESATIAWVEEMGGIVGFHPSFPIDERSWLERTTDNWFGQRVPIVLLRDTNVSDLSPLAELKNLKWLDLHVTEVNNLSPLAELKNLKGLCFGQTQVSDLSPLSKLKDLEVLGLDNTLVSDLSPLAELKNLEVLHLWDTKVIDLSPLSELNNLKWLDLRFTPVDDLSPLSELKNLEYLSHSGTPIRDEQVQELKLALPNCLIDFYATDR